MKADRKTPAEKKLAQLLQKPPGAVKRLGRRVFLKVPLYRAQRQYRVAYLNYPLFLKLFSPKAKISFNAAREIVARLFNSTIEKERSTGEKIGTAWCDRQRDPLNLSLSGNLGSGRAYYSGGIFNIKGEKTPLAISEQRRFSDGLLEMERAVWETTVANALQGSISTGLNSVLAILDMDENCEVIWRDQPVHRAKIIRVDRSGELDRITHLFQAQKPLRRKALEEGAKAFGTLEGDKFAERILHGSWSAGNISLRGHLIDFDTVCATKGRTPQYSFTRWHYQNYFGYEIYGQLEILKAIAADRKLNADKVPFDELQDIALAALQERRAPRLLSLMGFVDADKTWRQFRGDLLELAELWSELARKTYKQTENFSVKLASSLDVHVFDFSAFFRAYPLQKRHGLFTPQTGLQLLFGNAFQPPSPEEDFKLPVQHEYRDKLHAAIGEHFVTSQEELQMMRIAAAQFVKNYDRLHEKILGVAKDDLRRVEARAYVLNEDRTYMFPAYTASYSIAQQEPPFPPPVFQGLMEGLLAANRRGTDGKFMTDIRLYREGYSYRLLDGRGAFQAGFHFFIPRDLSPYGWIGKKSRSGKVISRRGKTDLLTEKLENSQLLQVHGEDLPLLQSGKKEVLQEICSKCE